MELILENIHQLLAVLVMFMGFIFLFLGLNQNKSQHCLKIASMLVILSVTLFANAGYIYFSALFIIATTVTKLDFLRDLAAIIRGNKDYFEVRKELVSLDDIEKSIEKKESLQFLVKKDEMKQILEQRKRELEGKKQMVLPQTEEKSEAEYSSIQNNLIINFLENDKQAKLQYTFLAQEYALKYIEKQNNAPLQKYVRFVENNNIAQFDGLIELKKYDRIFELFIFWIDWVSILIVKKMIRDRINKVKNYENFSDRKGELHIVLVGKFSDTFKNNLLLKESKLVKNDAEMTVKLVFLSFDEIGLKLTS